MNEGFIVNKGFINTDFVNKGVACLVTPSFAAMKNKNKNKTEKQNNGGQYKLA